LSTSTTGIWASPCQQFADENVFSSAGSDHATRIGRPSRPVGSLAVSDPTHPDHAPEPMPTVPGPAQELDVDLAAFLPEGVELAVASDDEPADPGDGSGEAPAAPPVDLEALSQIERDLDAVDAAIAALDAGTYGIDPTTGEPLDDALLAEDPTRLS
jgi:hypothetical protein